MIDASELLKEDRPHLRLVRDEKEEKLPDNVRILPGVKAAEPGEPAVAEDITIERVVDFSEGVVDPASIARFEEQFCYGRSPVDLAREAWVDSSGVL